MERMIELGHIDNREKTREEMLRELLAFRFSPSPISFLLPSTPCSPFRGLRRTLQNPGDCFLRDRVPH